MKNVDYAKIWRDNEGKLRGGFFKIETNKYGYGEKKEETLVEEVNLDEFNASTDEPEKVAKELKNASLKDNISVKMGYGVNKNKSITERLL